MTIEEAKARIVVALDFSTLDELVVMMEQLEGVRVVKIGLESICAMGAPQILSYLQENWPKVKVFFDGKFKDIPRTLGAATQNVAKYANVLMVDVFADAGDESMKAVVKEAGEMMVLGLTVLTSLAEEEVREIYDEGAAETVVSLACKAKKAGCHGIICSPADLEYLPEELKRSIKVTPGVRPKWAASNDQQRVMTPGEAVKAGADYLVIGRPITKPPTEVGSARAALELIAAEMVEATILIKR